MTRLVLSFLFLVAVNFGFSQPEKVVNAYSHLQSGDLAKAKEDIDHAAVHNTTGSKAKTWYYKGMIYYRIFGSQDEKIQSLKPNALRVAYESYAKAKALDKKGRYTKDIDRDLGLIQNFALNQGVNEFNVRQYRKAKDNFVLAAEVGDYRGETDSLAIFNAGLASEKMGSYDDAVRYYIKCKDLGYRAENMYSFIAYIYQQQGKTSELNALLDRGLVQFPKSQTLMSTKVNLLLAEGKMKESQEMMEQMIKNDPNNHVLHFSLGSVMDQLKKTEEARKYYEEALRLKPDYFDANFNLGALYFNQGVEMNNEAADIMDDAELIKVKSKVNRKFRKSLTYLEAAHQLKPADRTTMQSLKNLYMYLEDMDGYKRMKEKLAE